MMKLFILSTNIRNRMAAQIVGKELNQHPSIHYWTIDLEDKDKVLKIRSQEQLQLNEIQDLVNSNGYYCAEL